MIVIGLIGCSGAKLDEAATPREMYTSSLFQKSLAFLEPLCSRTWVISARHHLLSLDDVIEPYELGNKKERQRWGSHVAGSIVHNHGKDVELIFLAGAEYADPVYHCLRTYLGYRADVKTGKDRWHGVDEARMHRPLAKLQIGERLRWLNERIAECAGATQRTLVDVGLRACGVRR